VLLILIGIGIPLVLFFFQNDENIDLRKRRVKTVERELTPKEIESFKDVIERELSGLMDNKKGKESYSLKELDYLAEYAILMWGEGKSNFAKWIVDNYFKNQKWIITTESVYIPYKNFIGIGILFVLIGFGTLIFSFIPKGDKANSGIEKGGKGGRET